MNIEKAKTTSIDDRFPYLEYLTPGLEAIDKMPSPRLIKTHMPLRLLPKDITKAKVSTFTDSNFILLFNFSFNNQ